MSDFLSSASKRNLNASINAGLDARPPSRSGSGWGSGSKSSAPITKGTNYHPSGERLLKRSTAGFGPVGDLPRKSVRIRNVADCALHLSVGSANFSWCVWTIAPFSRRPQLAHSPPSRSRLGQLTKHQILNNISGYDRRANGDITWLVPGPAATRLAQLQTKLELNSIHL